MLNLIYILFSLICPKLLVISLVCPSSTLYIKLLIDTDAQINLIKRDIVEKLELKIVKIKILQYIVSYFRREISKKLQYKIAYTH